MRVHGKACNNLRILITNSLLVDVGTLDFIIYAHFFEQQLSSERRAAEDNANTRWGQPPYLR